MPTTLSVVAPPPLVDRHVEGYFDRASQASAASYFAEAGAQLREGLRQMIFSVYAYRNLPMPRRKVRRTTGELVILLERAEVLDSETAQFILEQLEVANRAAHCCFVTREALGKAIATLDWQRRCWLEEMPGVF